MAVESRVAGRFWDFILLESQVEGRWPVAAGIFFESHVEAPRLKTERGKTHETLYTAQGRFRAELPNGPRQIMHARSCHMLKYSKSPPTSSGIERAERATNRNTRFRSGHRGSFLELGGV